MPACRFTVNPNPAGTWTGPDLSRARRLVAASGTRGMRIEFWGARPWPQVGRCFRSLLTELGYRGELRTFGDLHRIYENAVGEPHPRPQIGLWGWEAGSPFNFFRYMVSCASSWNPSHFCDPKLDAQTERAVRARGEEASERWQRAETSLADQAPIVPLANSADISLTARRVGNYQYHPLWGPLIEQLWVR